MIRSKWPILVAVLAVALAGVWYFASPAYTLSRMKAAADSSDSDAMARYIDFAALREDLKADLMAQMMVEAEKDDSGMGGLGVALGAAMIGPMVDGFVTPAGLKAAFAANKRKPRPAAQRSRTGDKLRPSEMFKVEEEPVIRRRGFSEFLVTSKKQPESGMVFRRHGLGWKLSGVELPPLRN